MSQMEGSQSERVTRSFLRLLLYSGLQQTGRGPPTLTGQSALLRFSPNVHLSQKHPDRYIQNDESLHIQAPSLPMAQPSRHITSAITLGMIIILFVLIHCWQTFLCLQFLRQFSIYPSSLTPFLF